MLKILIACRQSKFPDFKHLRAVNAKVSNKNQFQILCLKYVPQLLKQGYVDFGKNVNNMMLNTNM